MILTPSSHPDQYAGIKGTAANVSMDIVPIEFYRIDAAGGRLVWLNEDRLTYPARRQIHPSEGHINLMPGRAYHFIFDDIKIPKDCIGELWPRSKMLRFAIMPGRSAIWDPGYEGKGVALVFPLLPIRIGVGIATHTMLLTRIEGDVQQYAGEFQKEGIKDKVPVADKKPEPKEPSKAVDTLPDDDKPIVEPDKPRRMSL